MCRLAFHRYNTPMGWWKKKLRARAKKRAWTKKRIAKWLAVGTSLVPVGAALSVIAIDEMRKRRAPTIDSYPHLPPQDVELNSDSTTIYTGAESLYKAMLEDIRSAKDYIYFEWFIMKADDVGQTFRDALFEAAARGVQVHVLIDTWGNLLNQPISFRHPQPQPNLHWMNFPLVRTGIFTGRTRDKGRDHRKVLVVDGKIGYVGGYNIGRLYIHEWRDTHIRLEGPSAWELDTAFVDMWNNYRKKNHPVLHRNTQYNWDSAVRAVTNAPSQNVYPIASLYMDALGRASKWAWITMGYFIPEEPMMMALTNAAERGVDVRILIPEYSNHIYTDWVARTHYERLLRSGVRIFLYQNAMIHAKTMTMDGQWSTVGTANIDRLSLRGNFEINMSIYHRGFADVMDKIFEFDLKNSRELDLEEWKQRGRLARFTETVLQPFAPLL